MVSGKFATDREERINYGRMREYRLARTKEQMAKMGLGALITWDPWNIRYISGMYMTGQSGLAERQFLVLPRNGDPHVFASPCYSTSRIREVMPWLKDKIWDSSCHLKFVKSPEDEELGVLIDTVANILAEHGVTDEPLGTDGTQSGVILSEAFKARGIKMVDAKLAMLEARKIKNRDEIECIRIACANVDAAFADIASAIRPGVTECELVGIGMNTLYRLGADETQGLVCSSGPRTNPIWMDYTDRQILPGDLIIVGSIGNAWQGYKSIYFRTFCCGRATQEQKDIYEECRALVYAAMSGVKVGNTTLDVCTKWPDTPKKWGYEDWGEATPYAVGHGVGLTPSEFPLVAYVLAKKEPVKLEEGMVIALQNWIGRPGGKDGVRLEEDMVITEDGYDLLTKFPVNEITECWI